jgi:hypothetical protein
LFSSNSCIFSSSSTFVFSLCWPSLLLFSPSFDVFFGSLHSSFFLSSSLSFLFSSRS